jgi:hypothetical protein
MAYEKAMTSIFSFTPPEWLKPFDGVPKNPYAAASRETLEFTAYRLQDQADHLKSLAKCGDLTEAMKCQLEFAQQSCSRSFGEASNMFDRLRMPSPASS